MTDYLTAKLIDWAEQPKGDPAGKAMCFLQGGRYNGDRASIVAPAPDLIAVAPCDHLSCVHRVEKRDGSETYRTCGMATHWHDVAEGDEQGDVPKHAAYYVLVRSEPAPSGMVAALYWSAGHERPTRAAMALAVNDFERTVAQRAAAQGVAANRIHNPDEKGYTA